MKLPAMGAAKKYHEVEALARVLLPEIQCREDRRRMGTAASHSLQLRGGNEHSQRTGTAHPGRHVTVNTRKGVFVSYTTDDRPAV